MTIIQRHLSANFYPKSNIYLEHIARNNQHNLADFRPFYIDTQLMGYISKEFFTILQSETPYFLESPQGIVLSPKFDTFETKSSYFDTLLSTLLDKNLIDPFRNEYYGVAQSIENKPLFKIKRGASSYFGFRNYGVHLNGYVIKDNRMFMWIGKRSSSKQVAPHKLDHIVGGGLPIGLSVFENLVKESQEEANIPRDYLQQAKAVNGISYCRQTGPKLRRDTIFVYDLELPTTFIPNNEDGEVENFMLLSIEEIMAYLQQDDVFKFNCNLVLIDFLIRHGFLTPEDSNYLKIIAELHQTRF
jgi:isopentenyldiphosphate isomerase